MAESLCMSEPCASFERPWNKVAIAAPRADGSYVAVPELSRALGLARDNHAALQGPERMIQGRRFADLRSWARREVLREATAYTGELLAGEGIPPSAAP